MNVQPDTVDWLEVIPTFLSATAAIAAAIAAFISLRISKRSIAIAETTALASYHQAASLQYFEVVNELYETTSSFNEKTYCLINEWAREIEQKDNKILGGVNPRPLRHVISDSSEMLATYGMSTKQWGRYASGAIMSIVRDGMGEIDDTEYLKLLKKADGEYYDFETTFGSTSKAKRISTAPAFRFAWYQLVKRVKHEDWESIWTKAWLSGGWLSIYKDEYLKIKPALERALKLLETERARLAHSSFPLNSNKELSKKYEELLYILNHLLEDSDIKLLEMYKECDFELEKSQLILCAIAISIVTHKKLDLIYAKAHE